MKIPLSSNTVKGDHFASIGAGKGKPKLLNKSDGDGKQKLGLSYIKKPNENWSMLFIVFFFFFFYTSGGKKKKKSIKKQITTRSLNSKITHPTWEDQTLFHLEKSDYEHS